jgi:hypothetical protein
MLTKNTRFILNLMLQFGLFVLFENMTTYPALFSFLAFAMALMFTVGALYGLLKLFNVKSDMLDSVYNNFPIGFWIDHAAEEKSRKSKKKKSKFKWKDLFTFKYLRYIGVLLVASAVGSLLFQIEWALFEKIVFSFATAFVFILLAEAFAKRKKPTASSVSTLVSFGLVLFGFGLCAEYFQNMDAIYATMNFWIGAQVLSILLFLPLVLRYSSSFSAKIFLIAAYLVPFAMESTGLAMLQLESIITIIAACTLAGFILAFKGKDYGLLLINLLLAEALLFSFSASLPYSALFTLIGIFVAHLYATTLLASKEKKLQSLQLTHSIGLHVVVLSHFLYLVDTANFPHDIGAYLGLCFLGFALLTFIAYALTQVQKINTTVTKALLDTSLIVSGIGFFLQVEGQWSAVLFLAYACAILAFGIYRHAFRSVIYGFIFLTVSIIKLYLVSPEIFDTVSGSIIILLLGAIIIALSYKFEAVKDYIKHF